MRIKVGSLMNKMFRRKRKPKHQMQRCDNPNCNCNEDDDDLSNLSPILEETQSQMSNYRRSGKPSLKECIDSHTELNITDNAEFNDEVKKSLLDLDISEATNIPEVYSIDKYPNVNMNEIRIKDEIRRCNEESKKIRKLIEDVSSDLYNMKHDMKTIINLVSKLTINNVTSTNSAQEINSSVSINDAIHEKSVSNTINDHPVVKSNEEQNTPAISEPTSVKNSSHSINIATSNTSSVASNVDTSSRSSHTSKSSMASITSENDSNTEDDEEKEDTVLQKEEVIEQPKDLSTIDNEKSASIENKSDDGRQVDELEKTIIKKDEIKIDVGTASEKDVSEDVDTSKPLPTMNRDTSEDKSSNRKSRRRSKLSDTSDRSSYKRCTSSKSSRNKSDKDEATSSSDTDNSRNSSREVALLKRHIRNKV